MFSGPCLTLRGPDYICLDLHHNAIFHAYDVQGSTFLWEHPLQWDVYFTGTGLNTMVVTNFGYYPPYSLPITFPVSVTSSNGGVETIEVALDDCNISPDDPKIICDIFLNVLEEDSINLRNDSKIYKSENEIYNFDFKIYPNPTKEYINLQLANSNCKGSTATIYNIFGKALMNVNIADSKGNINIAQLQSGFYVMSVEFMGQIRSKTFIKMK